MSQSIIPGDVVTLNGRRGRVVQVAQRGKVRVRLHPTQTRGADASTHVECLAHEVHYIHAWWNTRQMRAAFEGGAPRRRRAYPASQA